MRQGSAPGGWSPLAMGVALAGGLGVIAIAWTIMMSVSMHGRWRVWDTGDHMQSMRGGGLDTSNAPVAVGGVDAAVDIRDFAFRPGNLDVPAGAQVTFKNYDGAPHSAAAKDGSWDTGVLKDGESATLTFYRLGDFPYYCKVHPDMQARLLVE